MQNFFVGIAKKINNIFLVDSNKISIGPYLNENLCWANQIFIDSTKHFSGCKYAQLAIGNDLWVIHKGFRESQLKSTLEEIECRISTFT